MLKLTDGMFLYHGSYCEVECPSLNRCAKYKDFGQGFYLTTSKQQAESFAKISTKKAITNGITDTKQLYGVVSKFKVADDFCISLLLPNRLQDQFCFRTNTALGCLVFVESEKIWM